MFTLFWWIVLILPGLLYKAQTYYSHITDLNIASIILFVSMEFMIFFDLPGSKFLKNSDQFALKSTVLSKVVRENEAKIRKIRFAIFILTMILVLIILTIAKRFEVIYRSYFIFLFCTNSDIAFALATPEERKQYLRESVIQHIKGLFVGVAIFIGIFGIWFYFFK